MSLRHTRFALLLVVALTAITLSAGRTVAIGGAPWSGTSRSATLAVGVGAADSAVTQAIEQDRRDTDGARAQSPRLVLLAIVAAACALAYAGRRSTALIGFAFGTASLLHSPHGGRSPPLHVMSIV